MSKVRDMMLKRGTKFKVGTHVNLGKKKSSSSKSKMYKVGTHINLKGNK